MYVRRISRKRKDGSKVSYLQLARKIRDEHSGMPKDQVLYHFGREDELDQDQIRRLVKSLSRFLHDQPRAEVQASLELGEPLTAEASRSYGGTYVLDRLWQTLELDKTIKGLLADRSFKVDVERVLFAMVANRALAPSSKLGVERWVGQRAEVDGLDSVSVHNLYRAMDFLVEHGEELQRSVFFSVASLLNLEVDLLFFDTTSTYFEVEEPDDPEEDGLRRYGNSKDHRPDLPQVVIGLAVTRSGLPVRCWVLPGNTNDASIVEDVQKDMAGWRLNQVVWVMDRGFAGEKQRVALQRGGGHVIIGEKLRGKEKSQHEALSRPGRYRKVRDNLEVKEVSVENDPRRFVVVNNPQEAKRSQALRGKLLGRLEAEVERLNTSLAKRDGRHSKAVCALKSHRSMGRYVKELKSGELRIDRAAVKAEERLDGKYLLSTTDPTLSTEDVALGYKQLLDVERAFRTLKTTLELRPVYHRLPERIEAHVLLCWLALLLVRLIEIETGGSWAMLREEGKKPGQPDPSRAERGSEGRRRPGFGVGAHCVRPPEEGCRVPERCAPAVGAWHAMPLRYAMPVPLRDGVALGLGGTW